jgi:short-subunit dehydrogenase
MPWLLVLGAKSDIAQATAREFASEGFSICLAGRGCGELEPEAADISVRYRVDARAVEFDALDFGGHGAFYEGLEEKPAGVLCAVGYLGDQARSQEDFAETERAIATNFTGCVSILNVVATDFEKRKRGFIIGISSAAGDRGRMSNYTYGSAKAAFTAYLSGLRNRLYFSGVHVMTVIPGFVATSMTEGMDLPGLLTALPSQTGRDIFRAYRRRRDIIYTRWYWRYIMMVIRAIPETIFKRLKL